MEKLSYTTRSGLTFSCLMFRTGEPNAKNVPMLVYLHGMDGIGTDADKLLRIESVASYIAEGRLSIERDALIFVPQCPEGSKWYNINDDTLELIAHFADEYGADRARISLTGCSLGGMGTFTMALRFPDMFSCIVPVCGSVNEPAACACLKMPVWIFHGELDDAMGFSVVEANCAINKAGGNSRLTLLPGEDHEIRHVYSDKEYALVDWMLDCRRA